MPYPRPPRGRGVNLGAQRRVAAGRLARCIMPDILAFYESEEGQKEFAEWKRQQEARKNVLEMNSEK